ncbi:hypothetical protein O1R50_03390 [Glycomyces luteolus]|uniref:Uncharacterized protein n=1 Tax=Glycomyces luteolus TaxID=2670330 RepID=A0A9X3SQ84_9ACTN|nr:hypothetical protein [Glycomyces luteolus]MDA1358649.1 hypothetical protein [Glycomyces luteolus]
MASSIMSGVSVRRLGLSAAASRAASSPGMLAPVAADRLDDDAGLLGGLADRSAILDQAGDLVEPGEIELARVGASQRCGDRLVQTRVVEAVAEEGLVGDSQRPRGRANLPAFLDLDRGPVEQLGVETAASMALGRRFQGGLQPGMLGTEAAKRLRVQPGLLGRFVDGRSLLEQAGGVVEHVRARHRSGAALAGCGHRRVEAGVVGSGAFQG